MRKSVQIAIFLGSLLGLTSCASVQVDSSKSLQSATSNETLVWSDEFSGATPQSQPDSGNWMYAKGHGGGTEVETYCGWQEDASPCNSATPNEWVGNDGYLHILARDEGNGVFTSGRLMSWGLQSFRYGRIEARIQVPAGESVFPAFWMVGDNRSTVGWPDCGEIDIMEYRGPNPNVVSGSIHGHGFTGTMITHDYGHATGPAFAAGFHTYGILWGPGKIQFYVDDPSNIYATETPSTLPSGTSWPFDSQSFYIILNLAIRGDWGDPDKTTSYPQEMLIDYVRVYQEAGTSNP